MICASIVALSFINPMEGLLSLDGWDFENLPYQDSISGQVIGRTQAA